MGMIDPDVNTMLAEWVERGPPLVAAVLDERNRLMHSAGRHNRALAIELDSAQQELSRLRTENNRLRSTTSQSLHADLDMYRNKLEEAKRVNNDLETRLRELSVNKLRMDHRLTEAEGQRDSAQKRLERFEQCVKDAMERLDQAENKRTPGKLELLGKNVDHLIRQKELESRRADRAVRRANTEANRAERESKRAAQEEARGREEKARADRQTEHASELMTKLITVQNKVHDLTVSQRHMERRLMARESEPNRVTLPDVDDRVKKELAAVLKEPQFVKLFLGLIESWKASTKCLSTVLNGKEASKGTPSCNDDPLVKLREEGPPNAAKQAEGRQVVDVDDVDVVEVGQQRNASEESTLEKAEDAANGVRNAENQPKKKKRLRKPKKNATGNNNNALPTATRISKRKRNRNKTDDTPKAD